MTLLCAILISFVMSTIPTSSVILMLDGVTSFKRITNVIKVCKYPCYSQIFGRISTMHWRKAECYRWFQRLLFRLLCVEIDQLRCVNCWSNNSLSVGHL